MFLPGSLGELHAATNWIFSNETHWLSLTRQNPPCSTICLIKEITFWFPYLSTWGKLISSQNTTTHFPLIRGANWMPLFVFLYSQYWSNALSNDTGEVSLEKLRDNNSNCGDFLNASNNVIVFPEPGGPQSNKGLCSFRTENINCSCLTVSKVGTIVFGFETWCGSSSTDATEVFQSNHSPSGKETS